MLVINSYHSVDSIRFGLTVYQLTNQLGDPIKLTKNRRGEADYLYPHFSVRFSAIDQKVVEVGLLPASGPLLNLINIFQSSTALEELITFDGNPFEFMGFVILLKFGITMTGFHDQDEGQKAVTAFSQGRWDELKSQFVKFSL